VYLKEPYVPNYFDNGNTAYKYLDWNPIAAELVPEPHWKNKLFMPEKYARYLIKITRVRCERLMDITADDVQAEGVDYLGKLPVMLPKKLTEQQLHELATTIARHEYAKLWDSINVKWNRAHDDYRGLMFQDNPYVWVYEFELIKR
jgi:hypothetical protein